MKFELIGGPVQLPIPEKCGGQYGRNCSDSGQQLGSELEMRASHCASILQGCRRKWREADPFARLASFEGPSMKLVIIAFLVFIVASLGIRTVLPDTDREKGGSDRTVKALTVRISLSIALFIILMVSYYFGFIPKAGL